MKQYQRSTLLFFFISIVHLIQSNDLLQPNILQNSLHVQEILQNKGFKKVFFTTPDNIKLCGLYLDQSNTKQVKATILYCAGFYPGTKEGMSSFYTLLDDQPYNFLLFDARGHHESEGKLFSYNLLKQYGAQEYQDIIAAINFLNQHNSQHQIAPSIVIHGICAGAFHSIKACTKCTNQNIKGIIFDSGWLQVKDIVEPTICAEIHKRLHNSLFQWLIQPLCYIFLQWYRLTLKHHHNKIEGIEQQIQQISCPILFVHNIADPYVPINPIQTLVTQANYPHSWWIDHASHADFHIKQPEIYKEKIMQFLKKIQE